MFFLVKIFSLNVFLRESSIKFLFKKNKKFKSISKYLGFIW